MIPWVLRKLARAGLLVGVVLVLAWVLVEALPGDACSVYLDPDADPRALAGMRAALGCDEPAPVRFLLAMRRALTLDLGVSLHKHVPVRTLLAEALPHTMLLGAAGLLVGQGLGVLTGVAQALWRGRAFDLAASAIGLALASVPSFVLGLALMAAMARLDPAWPTTGSSTPWLEPGWVERAQALLLPALVLGLGSAAADARFVRSAVAEQLDEAFVRTARAKGVGELRVLVLHVGRAALLPVLAVLGLQLPALVSGAVVCESLFGWPGMGRVLMEAVRSADTPVVLGALYGLAATVALGGALTELGAALVDPRVRVGR